MIFVDVGAHIGQTIAEVARHPFDVIHAIEPMPEQARILERRFSYDPRVIVHRFALSHTSGCTTMFGSNERLEASLYAAKNDVDERVTTKVRAVRASVFFRAAGHDLIVNMNCEGAEVPILEDLLDSGYISRISALLVDFDASKIEGMRTAPRSIVRRLEDSCVNFRTTFPDVPTHAEQIDCWLRSL